VHCLTCRLRLAFLHRLQLVYASDGVPPAAGVSGTTENGVPHVASVPASPATGVPPSVGVPPAAGVSGMTCKKRGSGIVRGSGIGICIGCWSRGI